jgi:hypothetical protein
MKLKPPRVVVQTRSGKRADRTAAAFATLYAAADKKLSRGQAVPLLRDLAGMTEAQAKAALA